MKMPFLRRAIMATAIATSLVSGTMIAAPAQAQFGGIVYDPSNYAQNVLTAARTLQQINNQIQQIQNQRPASSTRPAILPVCRSRRSRRCSNRSTRPASC